MSSKTSVGSPPEYFVDRSLGKVTAGRLRDRGWSVHLISDEYPDDARSTKDEDWIARGCRRGWVLLTKDKAIRFRSTELAALAPGSFLFSLARADLNVDEMVHALDTARSRIERAVESGEAGFWHVYKDGRIKRMWP